MVGGVPLPLPLGRRGEPPTAEEDSGLHKATIHYYADFVLQKKSLHIVSLYRLYSISAQDLPNHTTKQ